MRTPASIIPKFEINIIDATITMNTLIPIPIGPDEWRNGMVHGVRNSRKTLIMYISIIDPTSVNTILLKVGVGRRIPSE